MFKLFFSIAFAINIFVSKSVSKFYLGAPVAKFETLKEDDKSVWKYTKNLYKRHKHAHQHDTNYKRIEVLSMEQMNAMQQEEHNTLYALTKFQIQAVWCWVSDSDFAKDVRKNWWKGGAGIRQPLATSALAAALTKNSIFTEMKEGSIWNFVGAKATKINKKKFIKDAQQFWKMEQKAMDANEEDSKDKSSKGSKTDDDIDEEPLTASEIFQTHYYPPFNPHGDLVLYFGLKGIVCPTLYVGNPTDTLYGPISTSTDYDVAAGFGGFGKYGTVFVVKISINDMSKIGGIVEATWLHQRFEEDEWLLYDIPLSMISIFNHGQQKPADKRKPCFRKGTYNQHKESSLKTKVAKVGAFNYYNGNDGYDEYVPYHEKISSLNGLDLAFDLVLISEFGLAAFIFAFCIGIGCCVVYILWIKANKLNGNETDNEDENEYV